MFETSGLEVVGHAQGYLRSGKEDARLLQAAVQLADLITGKATPSGKLADTFSVACATLFPATLPTGEPGKRGVDSSERLR